MNFEMLPIAASLTGLAYALYLVKWVLSRSPGSSDSAYVSSLIAEGARAFLNREYRAILPMGIALTILIWASYLLVFHKYAVASLASLSFAVGALGSAASGYIGMYVTTRSASRTAEAARRGLGDALKVSFRAGGIMGLTLASIGLLTVASLYISYSSYLSRYWAEALVPAAFGASLISLFMRVAGGIYTKAADWGADMVGKVEVGIPEDDPRNPAVIADNVGDNVGDVAGMASDVYESLIVVLTGSLLLTSIFNMPKEYALFALIIASSTLLSTIIGMQFVGGSVKGFDEALGVMRILNRALLATVILAAGLVGILAYLTLPRIQALASFASVAMGFVTALAVLYVTQYFTHYTYPPVRNIARQALLSASNVIVAGYSYGLLSAAPIIFIVAVSLGLSFWLGYLYIPPYGIDGGVFGTALASVGLLSLVGIVISLDSYGPVSDNANGLVEMVGMGDDVRRVTDILDSVGNTYKAVTKGYAIASAGLASLVLFIGFIYEVVRSMGLDVNGALAYVNVVNPALIIGALLGASLVYLFSSRTLMAVGNAAGELVEEVRRQFRERPGILRGVEKPDYGRAIDVVTRHALREFMAPALMAVIIPVATGLILGWVALVGLILGVILVGFPRALLMANAGGAWDNAKKFIEAGLDPALGGKNSPAHRNAVIGDVVGDPFKDTTGPSLNPLIKVVNTVSIVFAPLVALVSLASPISHIIYLLASSLL